MKRSYWLIPLIAAVVIAGGIVLYFEDPNSPDTWLPPCPSHSLFGVYCSGCGTTRTLHALVHGDLPGAMSKNPLAVLFIPVILIAFFRPEWLSKHPWAGWTIFGVIVLYTIIRNLPWYPFTLLAPH